MTKNLLEMVVKGDILTTGAKAKLPIVIDNTTQVQDIYRIPVKYLYFNNENGRISTQMSREGTQYVPQCDDEGTAYNDVFAQYIAEGNESALKNTKKSIKEKGQHQYGYVLKDGRIVDGNRRFTALRQIQQETGKSQFFEAVILPFSYDAKGERAQIKKLELKLQMGIEDKLAYDPLDLSVDIFHTIVEDQLMTIEDYASESSIKSKEVINRIAAVELIHEFLEFINAPLNAYHIVKQVNMYNPLYEAAKRFKKAYPVETPQAVQSKEGLFAYLAQMIIAGGDTVRETRDYLDTIVKNANANQDYNSLVEETIDDLRDALEEAPIQSSADLTKRLSENTSYLRELKSSYRKISDRENRGKSVENFIADVEAVAETLKDMKRNNGVSGTLALSSLSEAQIESVRDLLITIHNESADLLKVYSDAL